MEQWRTIEDFPAYEVSNLGRVRGPKGIFTLNMHKGNRYLKVTLSQGGKQYTRHVHKLVADAYIPLNGKSQINHIDGNRENNNASNIERVTSSENVKHAIDTGLLVIKESTHVNRVAKAREKNSRPILLTHIETGVSTEYINAYEAAQAIGAARTSVQHVLNPKRNNKTVKGYTAVYL